MRTQSKTPQRRQSDRIRATLTAKLILFTALLVAWPQAASAYPPAPGVTLKGLVRDEYGWVLRAEGAQVVVRQDPYEIGRAPVVNDLAFGFNYRVNLPVDSDVSAGAYRPGALLAASVYTVEIHVGGAVYLPIETLTGGLPAPQPGEVVTLNLNLGTDTDGDGLPDDWELWQLQTAGLFPGDEGYDLGQLGADGDYDLDGLSDLDEYLAGTFATLGISGTLFEPVGFHGHDQMQFYYNAVVDKAYQVEASDDGVNWTVVAVALDDPNSVTQSAWTATENGLRSLYASALGPRRLYRLHTR